MNTILDGIFLGAISAFWWIAFIFARAFDREVRRPDYPVKDGEQEFPL